MMTAERAHKPLPEALAELMEERGVTVKDLWKKTDLSPSAVYRYLDPERGISVNSQSAKSLRILSRFFGLPDDYWVEARVWRVIQIARQYPAVADSMYDRILEEARLHGLLDERLNTSDE